MENNLIQLVRDAGIIGAGGAGFPTYKKIDAEVDYLIVNGAECEPLLDKDKELLRLYAAEIVQGVLLVSGQMKAKHTVIGIKDKNKNAIAAIQNAIEGTDITFQALDDVYPAGDEYELVWSIAKRQIPPGGIPIQVGCVVSNVETFYNIYHATYGTTVTKTMITVHGEVEDPKTFWINVGTTFGECIDIAGGATVSNIVMIDGGPMMGKAVVDLNQPVTKTTSGILVLDKEHYLSQRKLKNERRVKAIGKSACDQCTDCTMLCPRAQLGVPLQPHLVMRALQYSGPQNEILNKWASFCVECNICSLYACPENLDPMEACRISKNTMREQDVKWTPEEVKSLSTDVRETKEYRMVPVKMLVKRLGLSKYYMNKADFVEIDYVPEKVTIPLNQHIGTPAEAVVRVGDEVYEGDVIASLREKDLGTPVHASINGKITSIGSSITIERII